MHFSSIMVSCPFLFFPVVHQNLLMTSAWILQFAFTMSWKCLYLIALISLILSEISMRVSWSLASCSGFEYSLFWILDFAFSSFLMDEFIFPHLTLSTFLVRSDVLVIKHWRVFCGCWVPSIIFIPMSS